ncbi:NADPH-dependent methylglyoxal reductase Gre2p [Monosporozyma unispora]|nr:hypothetical protein C6P44_002472 [Kazachstania unispora]
MAVLVTGATGFIAQYIINGLLEQGYKVIGTVRNESKKEKILADYEFNPNLSLETVPDLCNLNAFDSLISKRSQDIDYVLHTASPVFFDCEDYEKEILLPAINGMKSILNAVKKFGHEHIKRVVMTTSSAAFTTLGEKDKLIDETSWDPITWDEAFKDGVHAYFASKTFAEQGAWKFMKDNANEINFDLVTMGPFYVFGPQLFASTFKEKKLNLSNNVIGQFLNLAIDPNDETVPQKFPDNGFIDVRDVAKAHILAIQKDEFAGQRVMLYNQQCNGQDIIDILNDEVDGLKGKLPVGRPGTGPYFRQDRKIVVNNEKSRKLLGFKLIPLETSVKDMAMQYLNYANK